MDNFKNTFFLFQAVQAQNNKSHFSQCDDKKDLSAMFPTGAIVKVISILYHSVKYINNIYFMVFVQQSYLVG